MAINAGFAIYLGYLLPKLAGLHREPAGERVKLVQFLVQVSESSEAVLCGIAFLLRSAKAVVQIDPVGGNHPKQGGKSLVPHLPAPRADDFLVRCDVLVFEVDGQG